MVHSIDQTDSLERQLRFQDDFLQIYILQMLLKVDTENPSVTLQLIFNIMLSVFLAAVLK